jgi:hypothetical protein
MEADNETKRLILPVFPTQEVIDMGKRRRSKRYSTEQTFHRVRPKMIIQLSRRDFLYAAAACVAGSATPSRAADSTFFRNPACGCCHLWAERMNEAGLPVALMDTDDLGGALERHGVPAELQSCHVGTIGGYVISGHVPPEDFKRLLAEKPAGAGLAVPGMPMGSPGMDTGGGVEAYAVMLFQADGSATEFARHG